MTKDQIELLRPGFEAAIIERFKESGFLEVEIRVECLTRCGESYNDPQVAIAWWSWQQSRESLVVELPSVDMYFFDGDSHWLGDVDVDPEDIARAEAYGRIDKCREAIMNGGGGIRSSVDCYAPDETQAAIIAAGRMAKS